MAAQTRCPGGEALRMKAIGISLGELEAILAVMQEGSFRAAAEALKISQPSVSARVRHAEDVLGVKLFHRTTRKVAVTEHGKRLGMRAESAITDLRALLLDFKDEAQLKKGLVVIGATPAVAATVLPEVIQQFIRRWPNVDVILRDDFFGRSLERLITGEVDFALSPFRQTDPQFDFEPLYREEMVVVAPDDHQLMKGGMVEVRELAKYPLLTMPSQSAVWKTLNDAFAAAGVPFAPSFLTLHQLTLLSMVKAGLGVTVLPQLSLKLMNMEGLAVTRIRPPGLYRDVGLTTAHGRAIQPAAQKLMNALRSRLGGDNQTTKEQPERGH
jgi:DNA-binding transcriptional LysR family regulator